MLALRLGPVKRRPVGQVASVDELVHPYLGRRPEPLRSPREGFWDAYPHQQVFGGDVPPRTSAALLAFNLADSGEVRVFLGHMGGPFWESKDLGGWSIPKGEYDAAAEDPREAARREFAEEIGVPAPDGDLIDLGVHVQPSGKQIRCFAVAAPESVCFVASNEFALEWPRGSGMVQSFPEIDRAEWFALVEATHKLVPGQVPILGALAEALRRR